MRIKKSVLLITGIVCGMHVYASSENTRYPERIISLGTTVTENLYILGVDSRLIADTVYCLRPLDAAHKEKIGTVTHIDIEKLISLKPDLVLATSLTKKRQILTMKKQGLNVHVFPQTQTFDDFCSSFIELGRLVGKKKQALVIITQLKQNVDRIRRSRQGLKKPRVFIQFGAKPLFAATKEYIMHDMVSLAGGINIAADAGNGVYSREKVFEADPDIILIVTMGIVGEKEQKTWESYPRLSAVKHKRIYVIDSYKVCSPTTDTFVQTLNDLCEYFDSYVKADE